MELTTRALVIILVMVMLVVALASFFMFQSGAQISKADASRIFQARCADYEKRGCAWDVTYEKDFEQFVTACKIVNGEEREAFSCLYSLCTQCKSFELEKIQCAEFCSRIDGLKKAGDGNIASACSDYTTSPQCAQIKCGVCG